MISKQNGDRKLVGISEKKVVRDGNNHIAKRCGRSRIQGIGEDGFRGRKNRKVVKATQNNHCICIQVIFIIIITCNRPQICLYSIFETLTCVTGDPTPNFVDSELPKTTPYFVLYTNSAVPG